MSRAEKYIEENTRNCSQLHYNSACTLRHCITPDQARMAVEIAMEETIEKACDIIRHKYGHYHYLRGDITEELIKEFVKAMKDE